MIKLLLVDDQNSIRAISRSITLHSPESTTRDVLAD
jgi:hypothetical protein